MCEEQGAGRWGLEEDGGLLTSFHSLNAFSFFFLAIVAINNMTTWTGFPPVLTNFFSHQPPLIHNDPTMN